MVVPVTTVAIVGVLATALMILGVLSLVAIAVGDDRHGPGGPDTGEETA